MDLPNHWSELDTEQKDLVNRYIWVLLAHQDPLPLIEKPNREVVDRRIEGGVSYQFERVKCGKKNCHKCPHGPYWYAYFRKNGKVVSKYIGKDLPSSYVTDGGSSILPVT